MTTNPATQGGRANTRVEPAREVPSVSGATVPASVGPVGAFDYRAKAVHFDGDTGLACPSLIASPSRYLASSLWVCIAENVENVGVVFWESDPTGSDAAFAFLGNEGWDYAAGENFGTSWVELNAGGDPSFHVWHHVLACIDVITKTGAAYLDDIKIPWPTPAVDGGGSPSVALISGLPLWVGTNPNGDTCANVDMADLWIASGVNLLDGNGEIPEATRRRFISAGGRPVAPANFPAGAAVLLSGDKNKFAINRGSGGLFAVTGALSDATSSPSDPR